MARDPLRVTRVTRTPAAPSDAATGLHEYLRIVLNDGFGVDGVALRRSADGRLILAFPETRDRFGRAHPVAWPMDKRTRASLEEQVFAMLGLDPDGDRRTS